MVKWKVWVKLPSGMMRQVTVEGVTTKDAIAAAEAMTGGRNKDGMASQCIQKSHSDPKSSGNCFVATVAYGGNSQHPDVIFLRAFRDQYLRRSRPGRAFIFWYYENGPRIAEILKGRSNLKLFVRLVISRLVAIIRSVTPSQDK